MPKKATKTDASLNKALEAMQAHGQSTPGHWLELVKLAAASAIACAQTTDDIEALETLLTDLEDAVVQREDEIDAAA